MEGWSLGYQRLFRWLVRLPQPAFHIRQYVPQLRLGFLAVPAFLADAECHIAPLTIRAEPDRPAATGGRLDDLSRRFAGHSYLSRGRRLILPLATNRKQLHLAPSAS